MSVHLHDNSQQYNITVIFCEKVTPEATMILVRKQAAAEQPQDSRMPEVTCWEGLTRPRVLAPSPSCTAAGVAACRNVSSNPARPPHKPTWLLADNRTARIPDVILLCSAAKQVRT
jgi:hypothetical protein